MGTSLGWCTDFTYVVFLVRYVVFRGRQDWTWIIFRNSISCVFQTNWGKRSSWRRITWRGFFQRKVTLRVKQIYNLSSSCTATVNVLALLNSIPSFVNLYFFKQISLFSTRQFNVYSADVGRPVRISIRKDTKGIFSTDWYLEKVSSVTMAET